MLYTIERDFQGYTPDERDAAAFRAQLCISFFIGMTWVRSFYDEVSEQARCFYQASSPESLRQHAFSMAIPIGAIRPVTEVRGTATGNVEMGEPVDLARSQDVQRDLSIWIARLRLEGRQDFEVQSSFKPTDSQGASWVRAFIDRELDEVWSVYRAATLDEARSLVLESALLMQDLREMQEVLPEDVVEPQTLAAK